MIKLIDILNEARIVPKTSRLLPKEDAALLLKIPFNTSEDIYNWEDFRQPGMITYSCLEDNYEDDYFITCSIIKQLFKKYPDGGTFVSNDLDREVLPFAPNVSSSNKYRKLITIDPKYPKIEISFPLVSIETEDESKEYMMGWFDASGKYHPDINNFDKDGFYIGNA
jgi:hypothetical protein